MNTYHIFIIAFIVGLVILLLRDKRRSSADAICTACGFRGYAQNHTKGSVAIEAILWLAFIIPGLIYSIWRLSSRQEVCPTCKSPAMIPVSSPRGQQLLRDYEAKSTR